MTLSDDEAQGLLTNPKNLTAKAEALRWQNRNRFHGLTVRDKSASAYWPTFKTQVEGIVIVSDKRALFDTIFPFPVPTTRLLAEVQNAYMKLFDAVNPDLSIDAKEGVDTEFLGYINETKEPNFWRDESISALFESPEDLLVIDFLDGTTPTNRAKPILRRVQMDSVISIELNDDATCTHLAYTTVDNSIVVVDDLSYRLYVRVLDENGRQTADYTLKNTFPHNLGRCPARKLWDERVPNHAVASASIIDEVLSELDSYAFFHVAYDMFKLYGAFPIYYGAETEKAPPPKPPLVKAVNADFSVDAGFPDACKTKPGTGNSFIAPGEFFEVPRGGDLTVPPVGIVEPSTKTLEFHANDRENLYQKLVQYLIGSGGESLLLKSAINKTQATATFKTQENVLLYLSRHLSAAREWGLQTIADFQYGVGQVKITQSFGTEFYLQTETELWQKLQTAKTAGAPQTILLELIQRIQSFRLRSGGNPSRSQILLDLEPLREQSMADVLLLVAQGLIPRKKAAVKAQITDLILELEQYFGVDITQVGNGLTYSLRLKQFTQFLYNHVQVEQPIAVLPGGPNQQQPASGNATSDNPVDVVSDPNTEQ